MAVRDGPWMPDGRRLLPWPGLIKEGRHTLKNVLKSTGKIDLFQPEGS